MLFRNELSSLAEVSPYVECRYPRTPVIKAAHNGVLPFARTGGRSSILRSTTLLWKRSTTLISIPYRSLNSPLHNLTVSLLNADWDSIPDRPARSSVTILTELPYHLYICIYIYLVVRVLGSDWNDIGLMLKILENNCCVGRGLSYFKLNCVCGKLF